MKSSNHRIIGREKTEDSQLNYQNNLQKKNHRRKLSQTKEIGDHNCTRSLQNTKYIGIKQKNLPSYNNQNTKCTEQKRILKAER